MIRSLHRNLTAQLYSQAVTFAVQLGTVPFLISAWGVERFGVWLLLTAIPTYLAFSDFGFTFIAKNDMAIRVARGDREGALETFQSIFVLLVILCLGIGAALFIALAMTPLGRIFDLGHETATDARNVLGLQFASVLLYQFFQLFCAGVRCEGRVATETLIAATARLGDAVIVVAVALAGGGLAAAAVAGLVLRIGTVLGLRLWLGRQAPWLRLDLAHATRVRLTELAGPSLSYMLVPISTALLIQAPLILLGAVATPSAVALFGVTRTVSRLGMSAANMVNFAFAPEYSFSLGRSDITRFRRDLRLHTLIALAGTVLFLVAGIVFGPLGVRLLSSGHITPETDLVRLMMVGVALEMLWSAALAPLIALNAHKSVAAILMLLSLTFVGLGALAPSELGLASAVALVHAAMLVVTGIAMSRTLSRLRARQA